jgi:hypothetical protein
MQVSYLYVFPVFSGKMIPTPMVGCLRNNKREPRACSELEKKTKSIVIGILSWKQIKMSTISTSLLVFSRKNPQHK